MVIKAAIKRLTFLPIILIAAINGCEKVEIEKGVPKCVASHIKDFSEDACDKGANVQEFTFQGKTVYVFNPGYCGADLRSEVVDANCNSLGFLWGLYGNSKISGGDFANATFTRTVWEK